MSSYLPQNVKHNVSVYILLHWNLDLSFYKFVIPHNHGQKCLSDVCLHSLTINMSTPTQVIDYQDLTGAAVGSQVSRLTDARASPEVTSASIGTSTPLLTVRAVGALSTSCDHFYFILAHL